MTPRRLLLVRHGESTGNRDHIWAGVTDNELTVHGYEQARRLGQYLASERDRSRLRIDAVHASDLRRARRTAHAIAAALQIGPTTTAVKADDRSDEASDGVQETSLLREQDLGWREGKSLKDGARDSPGNKQSQREQPEESKDAMDTRARSFIAKHLRPWLDACDRDAHAESTTSISVKVPTVIVVSHGLFLLRLYSALCVELGITSAPSAAWSNTGVTTIVIKAPGVALVTDVNSTAHLQGLKRTRGVGSAEYDSRQRGLADFFGGKSPSKKLKPVPRLGDRGRTVETVQAAEVVHASPRAVSGGEASAPEVHNDPDEDDDELTRQIAAIDAACARQ